MKKIFILLTLTLLIALLILVISVQNKVIAQVAPGVHQGMDYLGGNLPGGDYKTIHFDKFDPVLCRNACYKDKKCKAYTMFKTSSKNGKFPCSLKDKVAPNISPDLNCISGIKKPLDVDKREGLP